MQNDNKPFDLPRVNEGEMNNQPSEPVTNNVTPGPEVLHTPEMPNLVNNTPQAKPIIEIPQEYYDKLEEERVEKEKQEAEKQKELEQRKELSNLSGKILTLVVLNAAVIFGCLFLTIRKLPLLIFVIPVFIVIMSIVNAIKDGKENSYPLSVLIGGMSVAVITFLISAIKTDAEDTWTYFAIASAITAFVGLAVSNIINNLISRKDEIKALQTIGYILFFVVLIGVPIFLYKKYPVEFHRIVFRNIGEVKAENEDDFILKTLKNRYNMNFTCSEGTTHFDVGFKMTKSRNCKTSDGVEVEVFSTTYDELKNQYIVFDNLANTMFFTDYEKKINSDLVTLTEAKQVVTFFYPEEGCLFVGDCANIEAYRQNIKKEEDLDNQYKFSSNLDLSKYMNNYDSVKFINEGKYKPVIRVTGKFYIKEDYIEVVSKTEDYLNSSGLQNNFGYIIIVQSYDPSKNHEKTEYEVEGQATSDKTFKNAEVTYDATK